MNKEIVEYILQSDLQNRLTPRIVDIAYTAFINSFNKNPDDGGPTDWFNDTLPNVLLQIAAIKKAVDIEGQPVDPYDAADIVWQFTDSDLLHIAEAKDITSCRYRIKDAIGSAISRGITSK